MKTTVTELPESRVRVEAEVPAQEVQASIERAAKALGREMRMPGFRRGKIPPAVVLKRVGRDALLDEALRASLGRWYADALSDSGVHAVGDPDLDLAESLPGPGEALSFTFEIGVRPTAKLGDYKGLEVGRREPEADEQAVASELEALRERSARLDPVDEPAASGDFVVMDYVGSIDGEPFEGGEGRDQMIELGGGRLIPGFEEQLVGARAGEERTLEVTFPDDYGAQAPGEAGSALAGRQARFAATVKEVKRKRLPDLDDAFAEEAAGFDSLEQLRADIAAKLRESAEREVEADYREAVLDAVVAGSSVTVPDALVRARAGELWERLSHQLSHQGIGKEMYLQISGKTEEQIIEEAAPDAEQALRREAVLAAVVEAEGIVASDGDVLDALADSAAREGVEPEKLRSQLEKAGRLDDLREDLAQRAALDLLVQSATPIEAGRAQAREKLWTPGKR